MSDTEGPFFRAGADGVLLEEFRALAETGRYPERPVLVWLARFLVGTGGGPNKDSPLLELCHLVRAVDLLCGGGEGRALFFLALERVVPRTIRPHLKSLATSSGASGVKMDSEGFILNYEDGHFQVKFGRMPFLMALYEFLASMDGFGFYEEFSSILDRVLDSSTGNVAMRPVKDATNQIASRLRRYRRAHMEYAANDEKFDRIFSFLKERAENGEFILDDAAIFDFWALHSQGKEFKGYKTVFDAFVTFRRALKAGDRTQAAETADVLGADRGAGEIEVADEAYDLGGFGDWASPLRALEEDDLNDIKFLKGASEAKPLEPLMEYGPEAVRLPLAFFRLESFAPIQSGITNDLQVKRGRESVNRRITCADAEPYEARVDLYAKMLNHVRTLERAALHAILATQGSPDKSVVVIPGPLSPVDIGAEDFVTIAAEARSAFERLTRKGFEAIDAADDPRGDAFRKAAGALVAMGHVLQGMIDAAAKLDGKTPDLAGQFGRDREAFRTQFEKIYGKAS